jgi:hypothetical protein
MMKKEKELFVVPDENLLCFLQKQNLIVEQVGQVFGIIYLKQSKQKQILNLLFLELNTIVDFVVVIRGTFLMMDRGQQVNVIAIMA